MTVSITKKNHEGFRYLLTWISPEGYVFHDWFKTKKELQEYIKDWMAEIVIVK